MGINFPASPLVGDKYPTPAQPGVPQYTWDGTMWTASSSAAGFVRLSGDVMTGPLTLSGNAVSALHAVPKQQLDANVNGAMAYSGMQINGSMEVSQDRGSTQVAVTPAGVHVLDGWDVAISNATAACIAVQQPISSLPGFPLCLSVVANTALTTVAAADYAYIQHRIEGVRVSRLWFGFASASPITLGFWVYATVAGTSSVSVQNSAGNRAYVATFTITAPGAWEYKTITIPGDVTGTWAKDNTAGMVLYFSLAMGTNYHTTAGAWQGVSGKFATSANTNFLGTAGNQFVITGVVVLPGIYAPTAAQSSLIMRPYDQELLACMRYYEKGQEPTSYLGDVTGILNAYTSIEYAMPKRASPTITYTGTWQYFSVGAGTSFVPATQGVSAYRYTFMILGATTWRGWLGDTGFWAADARL